MEKPTIPQKAHIKLSLKKTKLISGAHVNYLKNNPFVMDLIKKRENLSQ